MYIGALSIRRIKGDKNKAYVNAERMIRKAACNGAEIVCTTESFLDGYVAQDKGLTFDQCLTMGEKIPGGKYIIKFSKLARELKIYLIVGVTEVESGSLYNTAALIDPFGNLLGKYRKITECGSEFREKYNTPGQNLPVFNTQWGKIGIMICSDRNVPEIPKILSLQGAKLLFCPSCGHYSEPELTKLRTRSMDNGVFIVRANSGSITFVNPEGEIIAHSVGTGQIVVQNVDLTKTNRCRKLISQPRMREKLYLNEKISS